MTTHREFVIRHLEPWHEFCEQRHRRDVYVLYSKLLLGPSDSKVLHVRLPQWALHLSEKRRAKLLQSAIKTVTKLCPRLLAEVEEDARMQKGFWCIVDGCGPFPGRFLGPLEKFLEHHRDCHNRVFSEKQRDQLREAEEKIMKDALEDENSASEDEDSEQEGVLQELGMPVLRLRKSLQRGELSREEEMCARPSKRARCGESQNSNA